MRFTLDGIAAHIRMRMPGAVFSIEEPLERRPIARPWWAFWRPRWTKPLGGIVQITIHIPPTARIAACEALLLELEEARAVGVDLRVSFLRGSCKPWTRG